MDKALRIALRSYIQEASADNAHKVVRLLLRSTDDLSESADIPSKTNGFLTYYGLLRGLVKLTEKQLQDHVMFYDFGLGETLPVTTFFPEGTGVTDVLDYDHPLMVHATCVSCGVPFDDNRVQLHWDRRGEWLCDSCSDVY